MLFTELPLCDTLLEGLQSMNFSETTPVQEQAIPVILEKKDVIACAQTGTGKTAAFLLPLLHNLQTDAHDEGKINAIVMAPTRELAQQIDQQMEGFSYFTPFSSVAVYGGNDGDAWEVQKRGLLSGADVVIATPGRLLSHINLYNIDFSGVKYFILDEADRMLDMGFHDDIMKIEKQLPKERQTIMFSATMPPKIQHLAKSILHDPVDIAIAISRPPDTIMQSAYICHEAQKINLVRHLFKEKAPDKVILFSGSKQKVKEIAKTLNHMGLSAGEMHSDLDQSQRNHVMHEFKNERVHILVATDIVARGIDIDDISLIINFDVPYDAEDYVHRIGRTARAGDSGMAITFVSPDEQYRFSRIEQFLGKQIYRIPVPPELGEAPDYNPVRDNRRGGAFGRSSNGGGKKGKEGRKKSEKPAGRPKRFQDSEDPERAKGTTRLEGLEKAEALENDANQSALEGSDHSAKAGSSERSESVEGAAPSERSERTKKSKRVSGGTKSARSEGSERSVRSEKPGGSRRHGGSRRDEGARSGESAQQNKPSHSERDEARSQERHASRKQGPRKKQTAQREQGGTQQQGASGEQRSSSRKQRTSDAPRKQRAPRDANLQSHDASGKRPARRNTSNVNKASASQTPASAPEQATKTGKSKKWSWWPFGRK